MVIAARRPLEAWVFQTGEPLPHLGGSARPMRAANLTDALLSAGHTVTLWTADFSHQEGRHLTGRHSRISLGPNLEVRLLSSRGYSKNVGVDRLVDHAQLGLTLRRMLARCEPPDVAFVGYPPIEPAAVLTRWLRQRGVPTLLDVKDQWPDVLLRAAPRRAEPLGRLALSGYRYLGRRAMRDATGLSSISGPFLDWAVGYAGRRRRATDVVAPLTSPGYRSEIERVDAARDWWNLRGVPDDSRVRVAFVGTLGTAFDMGPVARAARRNPDVQFVVCGTGSRESEIRDLMAGCANVVMPGWVDRDQGAVLYQRSSAALAPYAETRDFHLSIPNKILDALMHGLPVVTSLQGTVRSEVIDRGAGVTYEPHGNSLEGVLKGLAEDGERTQAMRRAALRLHREQYSYDIVYGGLVEHLERLAVARAAGGRHA